MKKEQQKVQVLRKKNEIELEYRVMKATEAVKWDVFKVRKEEAIRDYITARHLSISVKQIITQVLVKTMLNRIYDKFYKMCKGYFILRYLMAFRRKFLVKRHLEDLNE